MTASPLALLVIVFPLTLLAGTDPVVGQVYRGDQGLVEVVVPRLEERIEVDGVLDEDAWRRAARLSGFSQFSPVDGIPAEDSTEVRVWYASEAIHFGIQAWDRRGGVNARLADRDRIDDDDQIQILLDTFDDGRTALVFAVNPLGVQSDGIWSEGKSRRSGGFFSAAESDNPVDLTPDFVYQSRGRVTEEGYEVEVRVPFESIRYQGRGEQRWRLNVIRRNPRSGRMDTWTATRRDRASFLAQSGALTGLRGLDRGLVLDVNPEATVRSDGTPGKDTWDYASPKSRYGANLRWGASENVTVTGTLQPDFSQVEADVGRTTFDPRTAISYPEKRPFFLEESERFETPNRLIYTRSIVEPAAAAKLTGKVSRTEFGILSALDDGTREGWGGRALVNLVRVRRDVGAESTIGGVYTDRIVGSDYNRVVGTDARLVLKGMYALTFQGAGSFTRRDGETRRGPLWNAGFEARGRHLGLAASAQGIDPDFAAEVGFLSRVGVVRLRLNPSYTHYGTPGDGLESWTGSVVLFGTWLYDDFFQGRESEDLHLWLNNSFTLRGGWRLDVSPIFESFGYPAYLYAAYAVERKMGPQVDTVAFEADSRIPNFDLALGLHTPRLPRFAADLQLILGRDENFDEWAPAYLFYLDASVDWRPTEQLRVDIRYLRQQYIRPDDGSTVSVRDIPRLKAEYQLTRSTFFRLVAQYDIRFRDALRDDTRSGDPILVWQPQAGVYTRTVEERGTDLQWSALFSYRPTPGTVLYFGYESSLTEPRAFRLQELHRVEDAFFLKLSYLFRL